jgi:hypothetical protein
MQIPTNSVASLLQQIQSTAGATGTAGAGALQELLGGPASSTGSGSQTASVGPAPLTATSPASQFSSQLLSALIAQQGGSAGASSSTASTAPSSLSQLENVLSGVGQTFGLSSTAAQSLSSLLGGGLSALGAAATGTSTNPSTPATATGTSADPAVAAAAATDSSTAPANGARGGHHHHHGGGDETQTLASDASSAVSTTASIAAGLLSNI